MPGVKRRRWALIAGIVLFTTFIAAGSALKAVHARDATATGILFSVAAVAVVVGALAVIRGTGGRP